MFDWISRITMSLNGKPYMYFVPGADLFDGKVIANSKSAGLVVDVLNLAYGNYFNVVLMDYGTWNPDPYENKVPKITEKDIIISHSHGAVVGKYVREMNQVYCPIVMINPTIGKQFYKDDDEEAKFFGSTDYGIYTNTSIPNSVIICTNGDDSNESFPDSIKINGRHGIGLNDSYKVSKHSLLPFNPYVDFFNAIGAITTGIHKLTAKQI
jgi:hypothetical protein